MIARSIVNDDDAHDRRVRQQESPASDDRRWDVVVRLPRQTAQHGHANPGHSAGTGTIDRSSAIDPGLFAGHNRCEVPSVY